jgi:type IV pilus assembly protein PilV
MMMKRTDGFTLIEVLVAVVVVSLGMLGIAGTLLTATRSSTSNYLKQQAVQYAYDIVDRMRANDALATQTAAGANPYVVALVLPAAVGPTPNCEAAICSATQMGAFDVWEWQTLLRKNLPSGMGKVAVAAGTGGLATTIVTVTVQWSDQPAQSTFTPATVSPVQYTVVTAL